LKLVAVPWLSLLVAHTILKTSVPTSQGYTRYLP